MTTRYSPCPACNTLCPADSYACDSCGDVLPGNEAQRADTLLVDDVQCDSCLSFNRSSAYFCKGCGHQIPREAFEAAAQRSGGGVRVPESDTGPEARRAYLDSLNTQAEADGMPTDDTVIGRLGVAERVTEACQRTLDAASRELEVKRSELRQADSTASCNALLREIHAAVPVVGEAERALELAQRREERLRHELDLISRHDLGFIGGPLGLSE
jgi:hypothetical protein